MHALFCTDLVQLSLRRASSEHWEEGPNGKRDLTTCYLPFQAELVVICVYGGKDSG